MGRGNWLPKTAVYQGDYELVYAELMDVSESPDQETVEDEYQNFYSAIHDILGKRWERLSRRDYIYLERDTVAMFQSGLHLVVLDTQGDYWHQGIAVISRDLDRPELAEANLRTVARKLWRGLYRAGYPLSFRSSAWTSAPHIPVVSDEVQALADHFPALTVKQIEAKIGRAKSDETVAEWTGVFAHEKPVNIPARLHRVNRELRIFDSWKWGDTPMSEVPAKLAATL